MSLQFQICSDLHLEFHKKVRLEHFIRPSAPYLLIAGDLGYPREPTYFSFLQQASKLFKKVFFVTGNHCYYGESFDTAHQKILLLLESLPNVYFLNNQAYQFPDSNVTILGTTLWSNILPQEENAVHQSITDYSEIFSTQSPDEQFITPKEIRQQYQYNVEWLEQEIKSRSSQKLIILTHHLPSYQLVSSQYTQSPINSAFASNLDYLLKDPVVLVVSGHTHEAKKKLINNVMCLVNPGGYPDECSYFDRKLVYSI